MQYSGVSTDEEMINVMKYQRSYDAAAKLITVADELMQTLLNLV
jgi:flagellar hook-associated protein 1 FlgK